MDNEGHTWNSKPSPTPLELKQSGADAGSFRAVFSTFGIVDSDGEIVESSAIADGLELPVMWAHGHIDMPVAVGKVQVVGNQAFIDGVFIDSDQGRNARATVLATRTVQELSWAFEILEAHEETRDGETVRVITRTKPIEVSFVLRGANPATAVVDVKREGGTWSYAPPATSGGTPFENGTPFEKNLSAVTHISTTNPTLSAQDQELIKGLAETARELLAALEPVLSPPESTKPVDREQARLYQAVLRSRVNHTLGGMA